MTERKSCDAGCGRAWYVKFEWDYTDAERYCRDCILEPIEGQRWTLLDYMPDCQKITVRVSGLLDRRLRSTAQLQLEMLGRSGAPIGV